MTLLSRWAPTTAWWRSDGHALIDQKVVHDALHAQQALLAEAGVAGFASTQMCFDVDQWKRWATAERAAGFTLPLHLGVPGVIDRAKLLTMGARLGIGSSMRFVKKNSGTIFKLFSPTGYDPSKLIAPMSKVARDLGPGHTVVTVLCDYGTRYQSKLFNPAFLRERGLPVPSWLA